MKLFGSEFKIVFCKQQKDVCPKEIANNPFGYIINSQKLIRIYRPQGIHRDTMLQTYLHEIIHAVTWAMGFSLDEKKTELLALGLTCWLLENGIKVKIG